MEQFRQIGKVIGDLKALMVFRDDILINQRQCCLLFDIYTLAYEGIAGEIKRNLRFEEKQTKWKALEHPLKELHRIFKEGALYIQHCLETKDLWAKAISLAQNKDCVEFHIHNFMCCIPIVIEAIEMAGEIAGCDQHMIQKKKTIISSKYDNEWKDPKLFQWKFGKQYMVSQEICNRLETSWKEDRWILIQTIRDRKSSQWASLSKQEQRLTELLLKKLEDSSESPNVTMFPASLLVGSKDYQVRRRLGNGGQYKEIQWLGEGFVVRQFFEDIGNLMANISILSSITHPNIMHFLCGFYDEEKKEGFLVMELMNKDLHSYIKEICGPRKRIPFSLPVAVDLMLQIARGMEYLHSHKIYHGDLNPFNILVRVRNSSEGYLHVKVSGYKLCSFKNFTSRNSSNQQETHPFIWYAPEVLLEQEQPGNICNFQYTEKADVYSFGMICFELLTGKLPFEEGHLQGDKMSRNIRAGERPLFPSFCSKFLTCLTKKCWHTDPIQRPSFSSICRILRYIKRFLLMNPDHSQSDALSPLIDYCDIEMVLSKKFVEWGIQDPTPVSQIPFHMFAYRVLEKEKISMYIKERSSESGSDGASICGDDNMCIVDDPFSPMVVEMQMPTLSMDSPKRRTSMTKKSHSARQPGTPRGRSVRPPQLTTLGRNYTMHSESTMSMMISPHSRRRIKSGHSSDSELP